MSIFPPHNKPVVVRPPADGVVHGERVILRPYEDGFSEEELRRLYYWSRDPEVLRWSGGTAVKMPFVDFKHILQKDQLYPSPYRVVYVILNSEGELIGRVGYFDIDPQRRQAELGVVIGEKPYWGQGYGSDAISTLLRHVFEHTDLDRIYLYTYSDNLRAQRCFIRCGFRPVQSRSRNGSQPAGELQMEITRAEWETGLGTRD